VDAGSIAEELYGLPASEFTVARDRHAAAARRAGDRTLAAEIKKLRRPTASAGLANTLVRQRADQVDALLSVGSAMRHAQARLDGDELRRLSQDGQRLIVELSREARRVAGEAGQQVSEATGRELDETLHAALADAAAGEALRSGCLTAPLQYSGFGMVDISSAVAAPVKPAPPRAKKAAAVVPEPDLSDARAQLAAAKKDANVLARRAETARRRQEDLRRQTHQLRQQLQQAEAEVAAADTEANELARARDAAQSAVAAAEEQLARARRR
jgi:hypothetical protein